MGRLISSFNPFDPSDPTYEMSPNALESMAMGQPLDTKYAGTNFYEDPDMGADTVDEEVHELQDSASGKPISGSEIEFEEVL